MGASNVWRSSGSLEVDFFYLPLAHSFARAAEYLGTMIGTVTAFAESIETIPTDPRDPAALRSLGPENLREDLRADLVGA
jgi:long-subunit acyl-CoA synthetase (AMP-forming)